VNDAALTANPDRVIHEPARLKIMAILYVAREADFTYLLREAELTRGNLSVQLSRLEEAGYIRVDKMFVGKTPRTVAALTPAGKSAFIRYRDYLRGLLAATD